MYTSKHIKTPVRPRQAPAARSLCVGMRGEAALLKLLFANFKLPNESSSYQRMHGLSCIRYENNFARERLSTRALPFVHGAKGFR